jgi:F-type H+-transporting ATPase subunit delta
MTAEHDVKGTVFEAETSGVSRNYAEAFLNVVEQEGSADSAFDELDQVVRDVLLAHPEFSSVLASPAVAPHEKDRILTQTFEGRALPVVTRFLRVLNQHGRIALVPAVAREARALWNKRHNRVPVTVRSATALDEGQRARLNDKLAKLAGGTPMVVYEIDASLIGGLIVQVGDDVYDASLRSQLDQMRLRLIAGKSREIDDRDLIEL